VNSSYSAAAARVASRYSASAATRSISVLNAVAAALALIASHKSRQARALAGQPTWLPDLQALTPELLVSDAACHC